MLWDYEDSGHWQMTEKIRGGWLIRSLDLRRVMALAHQPTRWARFKAACRRLWRRWSA